ncbi:MAG TPA: thiamine-phosphate kinase [Terriglobales bacterium]|nr:thiamine-phosphate kinase [Terriglobales bacterium]
MPELKLIERIRRSSNRGGNITRNNSRGGVQAGIGDDCAVLRLPRGHEALITTDFSLENVHFRRAWHPPDSVGHRCLARGLSDIAAMGGEPVAAFLSLALPRDVRQRWVDEFLRGLLRLAKRFGLTLAGGDTAQSPDGILADIVVLGSVPAGEAVLRSGARAGDAIYVTGQLGGAATVLHRLQAGKRIRARDFPGHFYPTPRLEVGRYLREHGLATAMIDISDGLSTDLSHICEESRVGARIVGTEIPAASRAILSLALHGGDDYELLFTAPAKMRVPNTIAGVSVTRIGDIIRGRGVRLVQNGSEKKLAAGGWQHFKG